MDYVAQYAYTRLCQSLRLAGALTDEATRDLVIELQNHATTRRIQGHPVDAEQLIDLSHELRRACQVTD